MATKNVKTGETALPKAVRFQPKLEAPPSKPAAAKPTMAALRAKMKTTLAAAKRGLPKPLQIKGDPIAGFKPDPENPIATMNGLVNEISGAISKHRTALGAATANQTKSTQNMVGTGYYFTAVFDTEAQRDAFIGKLKMKCHLSETGGLFIDGREVAEALGIELPPPDHALTKKAFRATGMTAKHETLAPKGGDEVPPDKPAKRPRAKKGGSA